MNNSKYYQGKFIPTNPNKYKGKLNNIIYRSSWEHKFMRFCDRNENIIEWNSEEVIINYFHAIDRKWHRYFTDFYMKVKQENGNIKEFIVEIKPYNQTQKPVVPKRITKGYINSVNTYIKNQEKWKAASLYCESLQKQGRNIEFIVITEKDGLLL